MGDMETMTDVDKELMKEWVDIRLVMAMVIFLIALATLIAHYGGIID